MFTLAWTLRDWANLSALRLPDTDDAVRLQQIRDWLAGQRFADVTQYRLGRDGVAMHWSRLPDLVPGGLIAALAPVFGRYAAELVAVILWPGLLFAAALALVGRIARIMSASVPVAILVAALAFPASAMFLPGRIDHHGLQLVLLLAMVAAMLAPRATASGGVIALTGIASLVIGMEMTPFLALACALAVLGWVAERPGSRRQLAGLALTLLAALVAARWIFATTAWRYPAADGFTAASWQAALIGTAALMALAALDRRVAGRSPRLLLAAGIGGLAVVAVTLALPDYLDPYAHVDPALRRDWLAHVGEAQPLFAAPLATAIGQCGLMLAGIGAGLWTLRRTRDPGWAILLLFQGAALAITVWQLRGAPAGALLAAPALALLIAAARERGAVALAGAWLLSAGILYPLAGQALATAPPDPGGRPGLGDCASPAELAALGRLPPGQVAGPIDLGAWGLAATHHRFLAAPYHRNRWGNLIANPIVRGPPGYARAYAARFHPDYLVTCAGSSAWVARARPDWLQPVLRSGAMIVYRIDDLPLESRTP